MSKHSNNVSDSSVQAPPEAAGKAGEQSNNLLFSPSDSALARQVFNTRSESTSSLSGFPNVEIVGNEVPNRHGISPIETPRDCVRIAPKPNEGNSEVNIPSLPDNRASVPPEIDRTALVESLKDLDLSNSPHTKMVPDGPTGNGGPNENPPEDGRLKLDPKFVGEMNYLKHLQETNPELYEKIINQFKNGGSPTSGSGDEDSESQMIPE